MNMFDILDNVRRTAERGRELAQADAITDRAAGEYDVVHYDIESYLDCFQHILDELERIDK